MSRLEVATTPLAVAKMILVDASIRELLEALEACAYVRKEPNILGLAHWPLAELISDWLAYVELGAYFTHYE